MRLGTLVFSRSESSRLPDKALRHIGGMPLLERVIRRAQLLPWPAFLATTDRGADDRLVALAARLGVDSFRGSAERVLERAVLAAEAFRLDAFVRLCGDRPLFPLDDLRDAAAAMREGWDAGLARAPDLVTTFGNGGCPRGLTTEIVRTETLRRILDGVVSAEQQEHLTRYLYDHAADFRIVRLPPPAGPFACPSFAVDTPADFTALDRILAVSPALDLSPTEADRIHASFAPRAP
jgi:spore coat polysaccharide biosynthesis protein SpsF (cytidylyltransferase family)